MHRTEINEGKTITYNGLSEGHLCSYLGSKLSEQFYSSFHMFSKSFRVIQPVSSQAIFLLYHFRGSSFKFKTENLFMTLVIA